MKIPLPQRTERSQIIKIKNGNPKAKLREDIALHFGF
jgi:hypothetical protein